jgi:uncharacterized delta-60 repeat protein
LLVLVGVVAGAVGAGRHFQGHLDRSFGKGGRAFANLGPTFARSSYAAILRQPDGGIVLGGATDTLKGIYVEPGGFVQRRDAGGALDTGFGAGMVRFSDVADLAEGGQGRVLVAVPQHDDVCASSSTVRRLLPDGSPDPSFGKEGTSAQLPLYVSRIAVDGEGRILVAGSHHFNSCGHDPIPQLQQALARLLPDGSLDTGFGEGGTVSVEPGLSPAFDGVASVAVREDDTIVLAAEAGLHAFTPAGAPEPGFGSGGTVELGGTARALVGLPGNEVAVARSSSELGCCAKVGRFVVSRYRPDGTLAPEFGGGSVSFSAGPVNVPTALAAGPDGSLLLGGEVGQEAKCPAGECRLHPLLVRFTGDGRLDPSFGQGGTVAPGLPERTQPDYANYVADLALAPGGQILFAGGSGDGGEATVSALRPDGSLDTSFGTGGRAAQVEALPATTEAYGLAISPSGTILVGGRGNADAHRERNVFVAFRPNGAADEQVGPEGMVAREPGGVVWADKRGHFYAVSTYGRGSFVERFDSRGRPDPRYGSQGKAAVPRDFHIKSLVVRRDGRVLAVGSFADRFGMAAFALSPKGRPDRRFGGDGLAVVGFGTKTKAVALAATYDPRGRVVLFGNVRRYAAMARLRPDGRLDRSFAERGRQPGFAGTIDTAAATVIASSPPPSNPAVKAPRPPCSGSAPTAPATVPSAATGSCGQRRGRRWSGSSSAGASPSSAGSAAGARTGWRSASSRGTAASRVASAGVGWSSRRGRSAATSGPSVPRGRMSASSSPARPACSKKRGRGSSCCASAEPARACRPSSGNASPGRPTPSRTCPGPCAPAV